MYCHFFRAVNFCFIVYCSLRFSLAMMNDYASQANRDARHINTFWNTYIQETHWEQRGFDRIGSERIKWVPKVLIQGMLLTQIKSSCHIDMVPKCNNSDILLERILIQQKREMWKIYAFRTSAAIFLFNTAKPYISHNQKECIFSRNSCREYWLRCVNCLFHSHESASWADMRTQTHIQSLYVLWN